MSLRAYAAILVAGLTMVVVGCTGGAKNDKAAGESAAATQQTASGSATTASAGSGSGEIGITECDTYMTKYRQCIESKVPDSMKDTIRQSLDQSVAAWKQAAATPEARTGLAQAYQQATDAAKTAMQAYGCSF